MRDIHVSIVSHGQLQLVIDLLNDIDSLPSSSRIQTSVTFNIPEAGFGSLPEVSFPINIVNNSSPKGYGANHNSAFLSSPISDERRYFVVMNPDLRVQEDIFVSLANIIEDELRIGVVAPSVYTTNGALEDSVRDLPTPMVLVRKLFGLENDQARGGRLNVFKPDWIAGMFMMFRADVFDEIDGFDDRYHLYYEDVDICSRLWLMGYSIKVDKGCSIIHDARRDSRRKLKYMLWHLVSIKRFFSSDVYKKVKKFHAKRHLRDK